MNLPISFKWHTGTLVALLVILVAATFFVAWPAKKVTPAPEVQSWPVYELPRKLAKTGDRIAVRIALKRRPMPTEDPLVWNYFGSDNPLIYPRIYELRFSDPPEFSDAIIVQGIAEFVPDDELRSNGVQGFVRVELATAVR